MKLLIIDDEPGVRRSLTIIASSDGWETLSCDQFADVVRIIRENGIDVLVCDYRMPPVTGFDLLQQVQTAGLRIPSVMISASASSIDARRARELGVERILPKPPDVFEVRRALRGAMQRAQQATFKDMMIDWKV